MFIWTVNGGGLFISNEVSIDDFKTLMKSDTTRLAVSAGTAYNGIYYVNDTTIGWTSGDTVRVYGVSY